MLDEARADVLLVGHTHIPFVRSTGLRLVANPGAVLRDPAHKMDDAWLLDPVTRKFTKAPAPGGGTFGLLEVERGTRTFSVRRAKDGCEVLGASL